MSIPRAQREDPQPSTPPKPTEPIDQSTPVVASSATLLPYTSNHIYRDERMLQMRDEITGKVVGPMPIAEFLDNYLPTSPTMSLPWSPQSKMDFEAVEDTVSEIYMYDIWAKAVKPFCPSLHIVNTSAFAADAFWEKEIKPDVTLYLPPLPTKISDPSKAEMMVEFKYFAQDDPFQDDEEGFENKDSSQSRDTLGQITTYATAHMAAQFRIHIFSLLVFKNYARILRWDRSGVVVTEQIELTNPLFAEFFWRYNYASPEERGCDTSVSENLGDWSEELHVTRKKLTLPVNTPLVRVSLGPGKGDYIIGKETYMGTPSPTGRSTRPYKAMCVQTKQPVFLKDTWRIESFQQTEHLIYDRLQTAGVEHVPRFHDANDILDHVTKTHVVANSKWAKQHSRSFRVLRHYRLVLKDIGHDLSSFRDAKGLVIAMKDAITAHRQAYFRAGILHCDISAGNILITSDGRGLLIDWDFCMDMRRDDKGHGVVRRGTWQFMSARLGNPPPNEAAIPTREDDLESFYHVLTYIALHFTMHNTPSGKLTHLISINFEDAYQGTNGVIIAGATKSSFLSTYSLVKTAGFQNPPLKQLMLNLAKVLAFRYKNITDKDKEKYYKAKEKHGDDVAAEFPAGLYFAAIKKLEDPEWMEKEFDSSLDQRGWEEFSSRVKHELTPRGSFDSRKRKSMFGSDAFPAQKESFRHSDEAMDD